MTALLDGPASVEPTGEAWPPPPGTAVVVLAQSTTSLERGLIAGWAAGLESEGRTVTVADDAAGAVRAATAADATVVPAKVVWLPEDSAQDSVGELAQVLRRGPWRGLGQARLLARHPERSRVLVGDPARLSELRARFAERAEATGDFPAFVARQADIVLERTERRVRGDRYRAPRAVVEEVLSDRDFVARAEELAVRLGRTPDGVLADARAYLEEMASEERRLAIALWARLARGLHSRAYRLEVDPAQLARLRELSASHPLVFLPSHRSNLDPYVMTSVTYDNGLPHNHVLGGINMAFWPLGPLGRRVGAVFIRRTFRDNEVYRFVLARYLGFLVAKRFNLEWYMEGGRSRTGKLLPPKLGLLNYLADAVEEMDLRDVLVIPTSIVYDLLHEVGEMTSESKGAVKQAEGLGWLLRYARMQGRDMGSAHVSFGEPLNLHEALHSQGVSDERLTRSKVAFEICARINRATVATAPALVSFALLGVGDRALTLAEVREVLRPVLAYTAARGTPTDEATQQLGTREGVERTLALLAEHGVVERYAGGLEPVYRIGPEQELVAAFYRNGTIHWFVTRAIAELALLRAGACGPDEDPVATAWEDAFRLRDLLKFEFFFAEKEGFRAELLAELVLIEPQWQSKPASAREIGPALRAAGALVAHRVLRSFVESYAVVADRLAQLGDAPAHPEAVVKDCLGMGQQYRLQRRVTSAEAVSSHLFRTCLKLAANRDLLAGGPGAAGRRAAFAAELADVLGRLEELNRVETARSLDPTTTGSPA
ncbi:MAG: glycerol-3-phosphate 1-O-acyltransferase [Nocardioides sp.]